MEHRISFGGKVHNIHVTVHVYYQIAFQAVPPTLLYNTTDTPFSVGSTPFCPSVLPHSRVPLSVCHTHSNPSLKNPSSSLAQLPWQQLPKSVYLSTECIEFPCTAVGQQAMIKIRVINKDIIAHQVSKHQYFIRDILCVQTTAYHPKITKHSIVLLNQCSDGQYIYYSIRLSL